MPGGRLLRGNQRLSANGVIVKFPQTALLCNRFARPTLIPAEPDRLLPAGA